MERISKTERDEIAGKTPVILNAFLKKLLHLGWDVDRVPYRFHERLLPRRLSFVKAITICHVILGSGSINPEDSLGNRWGRRPRRLLWRDRLNRRRPAIGHGDRCNRPGLLRAHLLGI